VDCLNRLCVSSRHRRCSAGIHETCTHLHTVCCRTTDTAKNKDFDSIAGFPNVVGAIDCSHIAVKMPSEHAEAFVSRKGIHTINVQAVCDPDMKITNIVAKWPGSTHDSFIWHSAVCILCLKETTSTDGYLVSNRIASIGGVAIKISYILSAPSGER